MNVTCCDQQPDNSSTDGVKFHPAVQIGGVCVMFWVILSHGLILFCFFVNRNKPWTNYSKQILSLSLDDFVLGIACTVMLLVVVFRIPMEFTFCAFGFYFFFCSQCASLYHVLGICVFRALTLMKNTTSPVSLRLCVLLILSAWLTAILICAIPFVVWADPARYGRHCQIDYLFGEDMQSAMAVLAASYVLPMIVTNILYVATCCRLMSMWKKVFPTTADPATTITATEVTAATESMLTSRSGIKAQRVALGTIGLLLFLFNIFTVPLVWAMWSEHSGSSLPRQTRLGLSILFAMNSAVNPFVYAARTRFLRRALKDLLKDCAFICF